MRWYSPCCYGSGLASALLMNDTLAVIGTALALQLAREHRIDARLLLLTLAFGITIGSVASPIGNPQNLLIAIRGPVPSPFLTFAGALAVPTLLNLLLTYGVLRWRYRAAFHRTPLVHPVVTLRDASARPSRLDGSRCRGRRHYPTSRSLSFSNRILMCR